MLQVRFTPSKWIYSHYYKLIKDEEKMPQFDGQLLCFGKSNAAVKHSYFKPKVIL